MDDTAATSPTEMDTPLAPTKGAGKTGLPSDQTAQFRVERAQAALHESEARFRATFEQAAVGLAHVGLDGQFLLINRRLCDLVGYTREELVVRTFQDLTHPDDLAADLALVARLLAGQIATYSLEKRYVRRDGSPIWINLTVSLMRQPTGQPTYFIAVIEDISARVRAHEERAQLLEREQAARAEAERVTAQLHALQQVTDAALAHAALDGLLRGLLETITRLLAADNTAILLLDAGGQVLTIHTAYGPEEAVAGQVRVPVGQGIAGRIAASRRPLIVDDVAAADPVNPFLRQTIRALMGVPLLVRGELIGVLHVDAAVPRHFTADELHLLELIADRAALAIDNARLMDAERRARREAEAAVRLRNEVLSMVTHDLRAPLASITARAQLVQLRLHRGVALDAAWLDAQMAALHEAIGRMCATIDEMSDVARLHTGQVLDLHQEDVDVGALTRLVAEEHNVGPDARLVDVEAPDRGVLVHGDRARLARVLENVIGNAVKYSPQDTPVCVRVEEQEQWTLITVSDRGVGIPADELPHVFTRYFRASTAAGTAGTGLGLFGSRAIVEQHGGQMAIESQVGRGTTVTLRLPHAPAEARP